MPSHPYISGPGSVTQMIGYLRKSFPATVSSETVKKFGLAPNNESYVINALQFIGVLDEEGKRTAKGQDAFVLGDDAFPKAFEALIKDAYKDLFDIRGDDAWTLGRNELVTYFRTTDKTSEVIGGRQAGLFQAFRALAGYDQAVEKSGGGVAAKPRTPRPKPAVKKARPEAAAKEEGVGKTPPDPGRREMAMTVRIEINLPANGTQDVYDAIFKSLRANLIND